jgi:hypothetical protein
MAQAWAMRPSAMSCLEASRARIPSGILSRLPLDSTVTIESSPSDSTVTIESSPSDSVLAESSANTATMAIWALVSIRRRALAEKA